ncbi:MAG TPA: Si-specific NAD(P)(+) transhydrogenase [Candidatus Dormibacteraeota bacterium]|nr:Si-specific NAD(P)(+) transhydrogenase [Candidatus Dormibacteraeota bacterium]
MQPYDLMVIGSGPGGQRAAIQGAKAGKRVAIVESQSSIGGVCINTGTIPSKTMREAVLHLSGFYDKSFYGAAYNPKDNVSMADLNFRVQHVVENEVGVTQNQLKRNGVDLIHGTGRFTDPHHIRVENSNGFGEFEAQYVVLATGTQPSVNPKVPINGRNIINSDQILSMPQIPRTLIVVGGGVIGVEYACMFATLGVRVIIVEKRPRLLEFADTEMVEALTYHMRDQRATLRLNEEVESVEELPEGKVAANLVSKKRINADALLYAVGRQGNVEGLNLAAAGLESDERGRIKVDADYRTSQPHIFAVGDVIGFPSLASVSMEQGRIAAARAFGVQVQSDPAGYPYGIYTIPQISFIGKTEEQLTDADVPYEVGVAYYREIARGQISGHTDGRLKILFHRETLELLGVHIFGEDAAELLHIGQAVFLLKGKVTYFINTVFNYPTLAECYKTAAFNGLNRLK